jgi:hypothetical protein
MCCNRTTSTCNVGQQQRQPSEFLDVNTKTPLSLFVDLSLAAGDRTPAVDSFQVDVRLLDGSLLFS